MVKEKFTPPTINDENIQTEQFSWFMRMAARRRDILMRIRIKAKDGSLISDTEDARLSR